MGFGLVSGVLSGGHGLVEAGRRLRAVGRRLAGLTQIPGGAPRRRSPLEARLAAAGIVAIAVSSLIRALRPTLPMVLATESLPGVTGGIVGPAIAAISHGLAGRRGMSCRMGRNYRFAAAGNAMTAAIMGALGTYVDTNAIFVAAAILCIPALIALGRIRANEIDYVRARNATKRDQSIDLQRITKLAKNRNLLLFAGCLVLFQFSNASMSPLVSQNLAQSKLAWSPLLVAGLIVGPQIIVALLAPWIGYWSELGTQAVAACGLRHRKACAAAVRGRQRSIPHDRDSIVGRNHRCGDHGADDIDHCRSHDRDRTVQSDAGRGGHIDRHRGGDEHDRHGFRRGATGRCDRISDHGRDHGCWTGDTVEIPA